LKSLKKFFALHDASDPVHVIWYIINAANQRVQSFDGELCRQLSEKAPILVLLNKADLCSEEDLQTLRNCILDMNLQNFAGVFDTVAHRKPIKDIQNCPSCKSENLQLQRKAGRAICEDCGAKTNIRIDNGLKKVIKATFEVLPTAVREAFISSQTVSFQLKEKATLAVIKEFYRKFKRFWGTTKLLKIIAKMMARIAIVWEFTGVQGKSAKLAKSLARQFSHNKAVSTQQELKQQRIHMTVIGIIWNRCLAHLTLEMFHRTMEKEQSPKEDSYNWVAILEHIKEKDFHSSSVQEIEDSIVRDGLNSVLKNERRNLRKI